MALGGVWRWGVVGLELRDWRDFWPEVDGAMGRDYLADGVFEGFDAFAGDGADFVEGELAALCHGGEFF